MFTFERCDAMPHNNPLVRWLIGCTSLIHDSIDTCDVCPSFRAGLLVASLFLRRQNGLTTVTHCSKSTVSRSRRSRRLTDCLILTD